MILAVLHAAWDDEQGACSFNFVLDSKQLPIKDFDRPRIIGRFQGQSVVSVLQLREGPLKESEGPISTSFHHVIKEDNVNSES